MTLSSSSPLSRRTLIKAGAALAAGGLLPRGAFADAPLPPQLTVAIIGDGRNGVFASIRAGQGGLDVNRALGTKVLWQPGFTASLPVMEAIRAGGVDFTFATATAVVNAVKAGVGIVPLAAYPLPADEVDFLVQAKSDIRSAADLKGKTIAHQNGTTGTYSLIKYLETAGLRLSDVKAVSLSGADAYTAFAQGSVDGWIHWQPQAGLALAKLGDRARLLPGVKTYDYAFYVARTGFAGQYGPTAAKLVRIIRDTQRHIAANPAETVAAWASQGAFGMESAERRVYEQLIIDARLSDSGAVDLRPVDEKAAASTQDLADNFHALGVLPAQVDVKAFLLSPKFDGIRSTVAEALADGAAAPATR